MKFSTTITVGGQSVILNVPHHTRAYLKANSIFVPLGPSHSEANFVMTKGAVAQLDITDTLEIVWSQVAENMGGGVYADGVKTLTFNGFYFNKAVRLLQGGPNDDSALYLVNLVDTRYLSAINSGTGPRRVNLRSYANSSDYLTGTTSLGTWELLLADLWWRCSDGRLGDWPGLPNTFAFDHKPENYNVTGVNCWRALNAILDHWDCAIVHNPLVTDEPYYIVQLGSEQLLEENVARLKWDGTPIVGDNTSAAALYVHFWIHRKGFGQERHTELSSNWAFNGTHVTIASSTNIDGAIGSKPIHTDLPIVLNENGIITNLTAAQTRTTRLTQSYVLRETTSPIHKVFSGLLDDYVLGGRLRGILWRNYDDGQGTQTEIIGGPDLISNVEDGQLNLVDRNITTPANEHYSPPDLSRHSYPNYPHIVNVVQCTSQSGNFVYGNASHPNAQGFHYGMVRRWVNNSMARMDRCWIRFIDDHDVDNGQVQGILGQFYGPAMLSGISTAGGVTYPVYLVSTNCCPSSGSGGHSGSQDGGSLEGPPDDNPVSQTCCLDERGDWPADFPDTLTLAVNGSCCTNFNSSYPLTKVASAATPTYTGTAKTITGCAPVTIFATPSLTCIDGEWTTKFIISSQVVDPTNPCARSGGVISTTTTLVACVPLQLTGTGITAAGKLAVGATGCEDWFCNGTFTFTID